MDPGFLIDDDGRVPLFSSAAASQLSNSVLLSHSLCGVVQQAVFILEGLLTTFLPSRRDKHKNPCEMIELHARRMT